MFPIYELYALYMLVHLVLFARMLMFDKLCTCLIAIVVHLHPMFTVTIIGGYVDMSINDISLQYKSHRLQEKLSCRQQSPLHESSFLVGFRYS